MPRPLLYGLLAGSLLFVAAGIGMVATGGQGGWPGLLFFGLCAATFTAQLWPERFRPKAPAPADILARFPGPVELRLGQIKMAALLVGSLVFGGVLLWMLLSEPAGWKAWLLSPALVGLALAVPFLILMLVRGGGLTLTAEGFDVRHAWSRRSTAWRDTSPFEVVTIPPSFTPLVVYDDAAVAGGRLAGANVALTGRTSGLPDGYGYAHADLAALLNAWRERALSGR